MAHSPLQSELQPHRWRGHKPAQCHTIVRGKGTKKQCTGVKSTTSIGKQSGCCRRGSGAAGKPAAHAIRSTAGRGTPIGRQSGPPRRRRGAAKTTRMLARIHRRRFPCVVCIDRPKANPLNSPLSQPTKWTRQELCLLLRTRAKHYTGRLKFQRQKGLGVVAPCIYSAAPRVQPQHLLQQRHLRLERCSTNMPIAALFRRRGQFTRGSGVVCARAKLVTPRKIHTFCAKGAWQCSHRDRQPQQQQQQPQHLRISEATVSTYREAALRRYLEAALRPMSRRRTRLVLLSARWGAHASLAESGSCMLPPMTFARGRTLASRRTTWCCSSAVTAWSAT